MIFGSFIYTNNVVRKSRDNDPIMINIKNEGPLYEQKVIEAVIEDDLLIPGISGYKINIDSSYSKMKQNGKYDKSLLVFDEITPKVVAEENYDNYIISGNKDNYNVSLVFIIKDINNVEQIVKILNERGVNGTFFVDKSLFDDAIDLVKFIANSGNDVELLSNTYSIYEVNKYNSILRLTTKDKLSYCIFDSKNEEKKKSCKESKLVSILPNIITNTYIYGIVRNDLSNGSIISINNNLTTVRELKSTINYITQKGKKIILLKNLIKE